MESKHHKKNEKLFGKRYQNDFLDDPRLEDEKEEEILSKEMSSGKQDLWIHKEPKWGIKIKRFVRR